MPGAGMRQDHAGAERGDKPEFCCEDRTDGDWTRSLWPERRGRCNADYPRDQEKAQFGEEKIKICFAHAVCPKWRSGRCRHPVGLSHGAASQCRARQAGRGRQGARGPRGHATCRPLPAAAVPPPPGWGQGPAADGSHGVISPKGQDGPRGGCRREGGRRSRDHCRKRGREQAGIELQKLQRREGVLRLLGRPCGCDPPTPRALSQHVHCPPLPALPAPPGTRSPRRPPGQPDCRSTDGPGLEKDSDPAPFSRF